MINACFKGLLKFFFDTLHVILYPVVYVMNHEERKYLPETIEPLLLYSATKLANKIRQGEIRSEDVVRAYIVRCTQVNPIINAIVDTRFEMALADARNVDALIAMKLYSSEEFERLYPLFGVPITIKESIAVKGMSHTSGVYNSNNTATFDANVVMQVKLAGAIPILVSNCPEMCLCWETFNYVTGTTKNPYDTTRTSGGSSGGEASLLSSAASVIGIGSDAAGSLRLPAMYNGIFAHKPTPHTVSSEGHIPNSNSKNWPNFSCIGPMARYAEDLPLLLKVISDPLIGKIDFNAKVALDTIKLYYMEGDDSGMTNKIDSDIKDGFTRVIRYFEDVHGITVKKVSLKNMKYACDSSLMNLLSIKDVDSVFEQPLKLSSVTIELGKKLMGCSKSIATSIIYAYIRIVTYYLSEDTFKVAADVNASLKQEFVDLLQDNGVCFYPTFTSTATLHYDYMRHFSDFLYLMIFNSLGLPVTNCPIGLATNGMPVGVQVISSPGCDHLSLFIARELEKAFGGWIPPPTH